MVFTLARRWKKAPLNTEPIKHDAKALNDNATENTDHKTLHV